MNTKRFKGMHVSKLECISVLVFIVKYGMWSSVDLLNTYLFQHFVANRRNSHQVTLETVRRMLDRYEHNVTLQRIVGTSDKKADEAEKEAVDGEPTAKK